MTESWIWGELPSGFKVVRGPRRELMLVRDDFAAFIGVDAFTREAAPEQSRSPFRGREQLRLLEFKNGESALIRRYTHGGVVRLVTGRVFFTWPPRPFRELRVMEEARHRGVPTVEAISACVERVCGPFYHGWLATRRLNEAFDLWHALEQGIFRDLGGERILRAVAASIRLLHHSGVYHGDLNLKNILVRLEGADVRSYLIDFDKARLYSRSLSAAMAQRNLDRLRRSILKLDPGGKYLSEREWQLFLSFYRVRESGAA